MSQSSEYVKRFRLKRRAEAIVILGGQCAECGSTEELEIDHIDPTTKTRGLDIRSTQVRRELWLAELAKCQLLCGPHHHTKTAREQSAQRAQHGTAWRYERKGCRCDICKDAQATRQKAKPGWLAEW
jgi:5-methylcytosine-specific restriction endonuclease McrA